jgi:pyruvate,orthophosphate dikinase
MIETYRATWAMDQIVQAGAEFGSVGSNDLTQGALLMSRDDTAKLLRIYEEKGMISSNPFDVLDDSVVALIKNAVDKAKSVKPDIKIGICGEHGGDPVSIEKCQQAGLDYVSCSPMRVPTAILAAAQAEIKNTTNK